MRLFRLALPLLALLAGCPSRPEVLPVVWPEADLVVATDSSGQYRTVSDAVAAARDGMVILIKPGVYAEQVRIADVRRVTLLGIDPATTVIDGTDRYTALEVKTDSNRFAGISLRGADSHGAWVRDGHQEFDHCLIYGNGDRGIYLSSMAGNASAFIDHCTICDNAESGIYAACDSTSTTITNCIIAFNPRGIVTDQTAGRMRIEHNTVWNTATDFDRVVADSSNIARDPVFIARPDTNYHLAPGSPCIGAAGDGRNQGCY